MYYLSKLADDTKLRGVDDMPKDPVASQKGSQHLDIIMGNQPWFILLERGVGSNEHKGPSQHQSLYDSMNL